jgi:hypothetical protein
MTWPNAPRRRLDALADAGIPDERVVTDKKTGATVDREGPAALMQYSRASDTYRDLPAPPARPEPARIAAPRSSRSTPDQTTGGVVQLTGGGVVTALLGVPRHLVDHRRRDPPPPDARLHRRLRATARSGVPDAVVEHVVREADHPCRPAEPPKRRRVDVLHAMLRTKTSYQPKPTDESRQAA